MPLLTIPAADIDAAGRSIEADLPVAWLDGNLADCDLKGAEPGHVVARLSRSGSNDIVVRGRVRAAVRTACARCLEPARIEVDTELSLLLQPGPTASEAEPAEGRRAEGASSRGGPKGRGAAAGGGKAGAAGAGKKASKVLEEEHEFSSEEAEADTYDGETVVLDGFVREAILLEMPIFPLCSESCPGIHPAPEAGDTGGPPVDPRLAPLGALRAVLPKKAASDPQGLQVPANDEGAAPGPAGAPDDKRKKE